MTRRSWLFVPGDSQRKMARAAGTGADVLILDLEDSVASDGKDQARTRVAEFLGNRPEEGPECWVRISPVGKSAALLDLCAVVGARPDGIVLPKADSPDDVKRLAGYLDALEIRDGLEPGVLRIVCVATETPRSIFHIGDYAGCNKRLAGLMWGAEDLSAAVGATRKRDAAGEWRPAFEMARTLCLLAAHSAEVQAIDTLHADFRDLEGLRQSAEQAREDGFSGKIAIHPDQIPVINEAFVPSKKEIAHARKVVAAFAQASGAGTVSLDGKMLDRPHLAQARSILRRAGQQGT